MNIKTMLTMLLMAAVMGPAESEAQLPGVGALMPEKAALLEQGKKILADLMALRQDPKLPVADKAKVAALIPKAQTINTELAKPQVEKSKLTELSGQLTDLQKQVAAIKQTALR